jgi:polyhydroxyalkanoate synthesis regulator phasin
MLKEIFYTGMGATALLKEKVEEEIKKLEEKGKIKTDDAKSFLELIEQKGKEEDEKLQKKFKEMLKEIIDELGIATKEDIAKLKEERQ